MNINLHTSHPSAFISSTFVDLREERLCVADSLAEAGLNVNALDVRPASTKSSRDEIISGIRESDFVILIVGDRYGSVIPQMTGSSTFSITRWEYQRAIDFNKPVIAYFKSDSVEDDADDPQYKMKRFQFGLFKKIIVRRHNPSYFSGIPDLGKKVKSSLISVYRSGVMGVVKENNRLLTKISSLESELRDIKNSQSSSVTDKAPGSRGRLEGLSSILSVPQRTALNNSIFDLPDED